VTGPGSNPTNSAVGYVGRISAVAACVAVAFCVDEELLAAVMRTVSAQAEVAEGRGDLVRLRMLVALRRAVEQIVSAEGPAV